MASNMRTLLYESLSLINLQTWYILTDTDDNATSYNNTQSSIL